MDTYPTKREKENHLQICLFWGDMLVPWRVYPCWVMSRHFSNPSCRSQLCSQVASSVTLRDLNGKKNAHKNTGKQRLIGNDSIQKGNSQHMFKSFLAFGYTTKTCVNPWWFKLSTPTVLNICCCQITEGWTPWSTASARNRLICV